MNSSSHLCLILSSAFFVSFFTPSMTVQAKPVPHTSVFTETSAEYQRKKLPSGRYKKETYLIGKGVCYDPRGADPSLTRIDFSEIGATLAEALFLADYIPAPDPEHTELMIIVNWGKTTLAKMGSGTIALDAMSDAAHGIALSNDTPKDAASISMKGSYDSILDQMLLLQQMNDDELTEKLEYNANLLGYQDAFDRALDIMPGIYNPMKQGALDIQTELRYPRYFVILQAYDFQLWNETKQKRLLWTSRFSIKAQRHPFDENLREMAVASSRFFWNRFSVFETTTKIIQS